MKLTFLLTLLCPILVTVSCGKKEKDISRAQREELPLPEEQGTINCYTQEETGLKLKSLIKEVQDNPAYFDCSTHHCRWKNSLVQYIDASEHEHLTCLGKDYSPDSFRLCTTDAIETRDTEFGPLVLLSDIYWCEEEILNILYIH